MKYTNTSKTLCLVFHTLVFLAFAALGIYFGAFVVPGFFSGSSIYAEFSANLKFITSSFVFYLELAVLGISLATVACKGVLDAVKAIRGGNDSDVVNSFSAFIAEGWIAAIFFILNGGLFFGMISGEANIWFTIVMCLLLAIGLLIAVNIPTVKLFDGKDATPLIAKLSLAGVGVGAPLFVLPVLSAIFLLPANVQAMNVGKVNIQLFAVAIIGAAILAASIVSMLTSKKGLAKASTLAVCASSLVAGADMITLAVLNFTWKDEKVFIIGNKFVGKLADIKWGTPFSIMLIVFGIAVLCLGLAAVALPNKKKSK